MSTAGTVLTARVFQGARVAAVAAQAGLAAGVWASTTVPHVFRGLAGYIGGRNRGRLPFIEFDIATQKFDQRTEIGGDLMTTLTMRCHVGGRDPETAGNLAEAILTAAINAIRVETVDNYTAIGSDSIGAVEQGPWGHFRDAQMQFDHTFSRTTYEES